MQRTYRTYVDMDGAQGRVAVERNVLGSVDVQKKMLSGSTFRSLARTSCTPLLRIASITYINATQKHSRISRKAKVNNCTDD
jgi:hypothetical protein